MIDEHGVIHLTLKLTPAQRRRIHQGARAEAGALGRLTDWRRERGAAADPLKVDMAWYYGGRRPCFKLDEAGQPVPHTPGPFVGGVFVGDAP